MILPEGFIFRFDPQMSEFFIAYSKGFMMWKETSKASFALFRVVKQDQTGPGQAPGLFAQYPVRREWFRPKTQKWSILALSNAL